MRLQAPEVPHNVYVHTHTRTHAHTDTGHTKGGTQGNIHTTIPPGTHQAAHSDGLRSDQARETSPHRPSAPAPPSRVAGTSTGNSPARCPHCRTRRWQWTAATARTPAQRVAVGAATAAGCDETGLWETQGHAQRLLSHVPPVRCRRTYPAPHPRDLAPKQTLHTRARAVTCQHRPTLVHKHTQRTHHAHAHTRHKGNSPPPFLTLGRRQR